MLPVVAGVFAERGVTALVFRGEDGLDELSTAAPSTVFVVRDGAATQTRFDPADIGIPRSRPEDLRGGDVQFNAAAVHDLVRGETGPVRDAVLLNAAAALVALDGPTDDLVNDLGTAVVRAAEAVDSGRAAATLDRWVEISRSHSA
jgi:anthranilate phosphoribosyltransferase